MIKSRSLRAITITLLLLLFAATTLAQDTGILWGEALLRVFRDKAGLGPNPAYENRIKQPFVPTEPAITEVPEIFEEPEISERPTEPTITKILVRPEPKPLPKPVPKLVPKPVADELLAMVPAESLLCLRINNFEYNVSQIDQFMAGVSPVPIGLSMLVRMQFANVLGSPQLTGVNMSGSFAIFATTAPGESIEMDLISILVPITDYKQFISGNQNISPPDGKGVSKITGEVDALVMQLGNYALIKSSESYDKLLKMAKAISEGKTAGLATALDDAEAQKATRQAIWAYGNIELTQKTLGTEISDGLEGIKMMAGAMMPTGPGGASPAAALDMDIENLMKQIRYLSLTLNPKPNVLNITTAISGVPGTKVAQTFSAHGKMGSSTDFPTILMLSQMLGAKDPKEMGPPGKMGSSTQLKSIAALIPNANKADYVGTYNLMNLFKLAMAFAPMPAPKMDMPAKSNIAFAGKVGKGTSTIDIALPKEHLAEIAAAAMMMQQQMGASEGPNLEPFKDMSTWVTCRNPACKAAYEMNLKEYHEFIQANADPRSPMPPAMVCKKCRQKSVFRAVKCAKCGFVFERGTVLADFADRCPKCRYSKTEQDRKKAAEARK